MWVCKVLITTDPSLIASGIVQHSLSEIPNFGILNYSGDKIFAVVEDTNRSACETRIDRIRQVPGVNRIETLLGKESMHGVFSSPERQSFGRKISQSIWNGIIEHPGNANG